MSALPSNMIDCARAVPIASVIEAHGIKLRGRVDRYGPCPVCGGVDRFAINTRKQVFLCRQCGGKGDAIALTQFIDGCDFPTAVETLAGETTVRRESQIRIPEPPRKDDHSDAEKSAEALALLWGPARDPRETLVDWYLNKERWLDPDDGVAGDVLRWTDDIKALTRLFGHRLPQGTVGAMVALFRNIKTNEPQAVSCTFLNSAAEKLGRLFKAPVGGAAIKLDRDEDVLGGLFIAEGIETAMTGRLPRYGLRPVWALGSAGAIENFPVLSGIEALSIHRERCSANAKAATECGTRWRDAGREVIDVWPDEDFKDLNDELRGRRMQ